MDPDNDVGGFVLGLAIENSSLRGGERNANTATTTTPPTGDHHAEVTADPYSLYLSSVRTGNAYAISAIAQMCLDGLVPKSQYDAILDILTSIHVGGDGGRSNPFFFGRQQRSNDYGIGNDHRSSSCGGLAITLWYHAAIRGGHRVAQVSLADEIMRRYYPSMEVEGDSNDNAEDPSSDDDYRRRSSSLSWEDMLLAASVLFTMAHDQGHFDSRLAL